MHEFKKVGHVEEKTRDATPVFFPNRIIFYFTTAKMCAKINDASKPFGLKTSFVYTLKAANKAAFSCEKNS